MQELLTSIAQGMLHIEPQQNPDLELIIDHQPWTVTYSYRPDVAPTVIVNAHERKCHIINENVALAKKMVWRQYYTVPEWGPNLDYR